MKALLFAPVGLLVACGTQSDGPPPSVQVVGNVVGVFQSSTSLDVEPPSTLLSMSVSRVEEGCGSIELERAWFAPSGQQPVALDTDDGRTYRAGVRDAAPSYDLHGARGDDSIQATISAPAPFALAATAGAAGQPGTVTWTVDPAPEGVSVWVSIGGPGGLVSLVDLPDSGTVEVPGSAFAEPGEYVVEVEKRTGRDSWWCAEYDGPDDTSGCCGFWSAQIHRSVTVTIPGAR